MLYYGPAGRPIRHIVYQRRGRWKEPHPSLQRDFGGAAQSYLAWTDRSNRDGSDAETIWAERRRFSMRSSWPFGWVCIPWWLGPPAAKNTQFSRTSRQPWPEPKMTDLAQVNRVP